MGNGAAAVFGRRVREERVRRGWRLADLAAAVAGHGVTLHLTAYAKTETGEREPRIGEAMAIAAALEIPLGALLIDSSALEAEVERLRKASVAAGEESDNALRRAVQYRNEAARLAGEELP
jgi:transcriptional regulator with XRE-family HTH domain